MRIDYKEKNQLTSEIMSRTITKEPHSLVDFGKPPFLTILSSPLTLDRRLVLDETQFLLDSFGLDASVPDSPYNFWFVPYDSDTTWIRLQVEGDVQRAHRSHLRISVNIAS